MSTVGDVAIAMFDRWAEVYDDEPNPMLALEERILPALFPTLAGADILDIGCGTGRWLQRLQAYCPRSLTGTDPSAAMLERARHKLPSSTVLHPVKSSIPEPADSCDLLLSSFVLDYVEDLEAFVTECARLLRPGGRLIISDLHPDTSARQGWTRSFTVRGASAHLPTQGRQLPEILRAFSQAFDLESLQEPSFSSLERPLFEQAGKLSAFNDLTGHPILYLLKLQKQGTMLTLKGAPWSTGPDHWSAPPIAILNGSIGNEPSASTDFLDLSGYVLLPGLINAHDHLEFSLFPNLGRASDAVPYSNSSEWAREIHQSHTATIAKHLEVPLETRLWWGAIRNLLSGVTTVCHHNPIHATLTEPGFPVRVVTGFTMAHSLTFALDLPEALPPNPFILHAAEGIDAQSRHEVLQLDDLNLLASNTVLVHGLALTPAEITLINNRNASVILCPTSNRFLFRQTLPLSSIVAIDRKALGSDSPLTASGDLLDEIRFLADTHACDPAALYNFVTINPASILHLKQGQGEIVPGAPADLIATRELNLSPSETLASLTFADIELVFVGGKIQLASSDIYDRLTPSQRIGLSPLFVDGYQRWLRAPISNLIADAEAVLGSGKLRLGNKEVQCSSTR